MYIIYLIQYNTQFIFFFNEYFYFILELFFQYASKKHDTYSSYIAVKYASKHSSIKKT